MKHFTKLLLALSFSTGPASTVLAKETSALEEEKVLAQAYLTEMKNEPNTVEIESGILMREIHKSDSKVFPTLQSRVKVLYEGFDREGFVFDSAFQRDQAISFPLGNLISCWQLAIPKISVGSVYKITCPANTAYGDEGAGNGQIKPGAALSFRIIVLEVQEN